MVETAEPEGRPAPEWPAQFSEIVHSLIAEYSNLATVIGGNERVPADIRDAVIQHAAEVLGALPDQFREAARG